MVGFFDGLDNLIGGSIDSFNDLSYSLQVWLAQMGVFWAVLMLLFMIFLWVMTFRLFWWMLWKYFPDISDMFDMLGEHRVKK